MTEQAKNRKFSRMAIAAAITMTAILLAIPAAVMAQTADPSAGASGTAGASGSPSGANGQPKEVNALQAQADTIKAELATDDQYLEILVEQQNATRINLDNLTKQLADSRAQLDDMIAQKNAQENILSNRLAAVYKAGDINILSILLSANSFSDFLDEAQYLNKVNEQDAKLERQFTDSAEAIQQATDDIDQKRAEQMQLQQQLGEEQQQLQAKVDERQAKLDQINSQVQQIIQQEEEQQRAAEAQLAAQQAALLQNLNITDATQAQVVETALHYLGVPYVWGGESPRGFDCSGLTKFVFAQHGVQLPHNAAMQFQLGASVPVDQLQPGDLIFYGPGNPHHVTMYIGNGKMIEAPTFGEVVKVSDLRVDSDYAGARRYPLQPRVGPPR